MRHGESHGSGEALLEEGEPPWLQVRREPFEYGMLPLCSLTHPDVAALQLLQGKLLDNSLPQLHWLGKQLQQQVVEAEQLLLRTQEDIGGGRSRVGVAGIAAALEVPEPHALLVLDMLSSVLPPDDPLEQAFPPDIDNVGADIDDLLIFLYIQIYRRLPPRPHKDPAAVADVWPSTSPFDGLLSSLSPLQVKPTKKSLPCQAEEEAHQLGFVQKHLYSLLHLLSQTSEDGTEVLTLERFNRLGLLCRPIDANGRVTSMSQAAPFFANSDPDMPAAAVPLAQAVEWVSQHLTSSCKSRERVAAKENGPPDTAHVTEGDVNMLDACQPYLPNGFNNRSRDLVFDGLTFVDGVTKSATMKSEADVRGDVVKVSNCHDAMVHVLAPMKFASVFGCSDSIVVLGAVGKAVRVEHCERVQLIVSCARICISNCRECVFYLGVNQRPLILGNNHNLQVAPYNTFYPKLEAHMAEVKVDPTVNRWDKVLTFGSVDPHDSISRSPGVVDVQAEGATIVTPDRFCSFLIPKWEAAGDGATGQHVLTRANPFLLPKVYLVALQQRSKAMESLRQMLRSVPLDESRKRDLSNAIHAHFKEWLYASGNIRQVYDFQQGTD